MAKKITHKKTCPACNGNGKSYGPRYCRRCKGRTTVRETITIEDTDTESTAEFQSDVADAIEGLGELESKVKRALQEMGDSDE